MSVYQQNRNDFEALKSIANGLRVELSIMRDWTATSGRGYSASMDSPADWSQPGRLIWRFDISAVSNLTRSPYVYRLGSMVESFARLNLSVSRLFQLYDEYRSFVNSDPGMFLQSRVPPEHTRAIVNFNRSMHVDLIGGADSPDPTCLYRAYGDADSALQTFEANLQRSRLPGWFWIGHLLGSLCVLSGCLMLCGLLCCGS
jgi:hypothetical protein